MKADLDKNKLIDKLLERWIVEKTAFELYGLAAERARLLGNRQGLVVRLEEIRRQEKDHEEMIEEVVRALGGELDRNLPSVQVAQREASGLLEVLRKPDAQLPHVLHALLTAELVDNAGWDLLIELGNQAGLGHETMRRFRLAFDAEKDHLATIRGLLQEIARSEVLGATQPTV
jgi:ferritin-like protein